MKSLSNDQFQKLTVRLTSSEKEEAKRLAKSKGMTFQGWLGFVIKEAVQKEAPYGQADAQ